MMPNTTLKCVISPCIIFVCLVWAFTTFSYFHVENGTQIGTLRIQVKGLELFQISIEFQPARFINDTQSTQPFNFTEMEEIHKEKEEACLIEKEKITRHLNAIIAKKKKFQENFGRIMIEMVTDESEVEDFEIPTT